MALNVVGSNPTTHPILILIYRDIAKSVRHQILILACVGSSPAIPARAISSVGRALDFQSSCPGFESPMAHQVKPLKRMFKRFFVR